MRIAVMPTPRSCRGPSKARSIGTRIATRMRERGVSPTRCGGWASRPATGSARWRGTGTHFELYYAVSGMGAVIHTINPRLFHEQIEYIVGHAEDGVVFFDLTFLPLVEKLAPACPGVKAWIAMTDCA